MKLFSLPTENGGFMRVFFEIFVKKITIFYSFSTIFIFKEIFLCALWPKNRSRNFQKKSSKIVYCEFYLTDPENFPQSIGQSGNFAGCHKKESCFAGFSACGGAHERQFPFRRSAILAERFLFHRNAVSYEIKNGKQFPASLRLSVLHADAFNGHRASSDNFNIGKSFFENIQNRIIFRFCSNCFY